jgi:shikimate dehydrogenase
MQMLKTAEVEVNDKRILLLGAGGAGRSVAVALKNAGARVFAYRRNQAELFEFCDQLGVEAVSDPETGGFDIIINATGVGMHDTVGVSPITARAFTGTETAVDLIYEPSESAFLQIAKRARVRTRINGKAMLFSQAYYADCLFLEREADSKEAEALYRKYLEAEKGL